MAFQRERRVAAGVDTSLPAKAELHFPRLTQKREKSILGAVGD
jgi:hypothetical protein